MQDATAAEFERLRPYLLRVAYSHLGSVAEAEDVVQEAWLRLERTGRDEIRDLRAWLTTVVGRIALNALTSARADASSTSVRGSPSRSSTPTRRRPTRPGTSTSTSP